MKKLIAFVLIVCMSFCLSGCNLSVVEDSLDEYIAFVKKNEFGFSSLGIDDSKYFLPSASFLTDYEYLEGMYFLRDEDSWREWLGLKENIPEIAILTLKYDESTYEKAKQVMLEEIKPYNDKFYYYNDYNFYINSNHLDIVIDGETRFPQSFTMACYNDENYTLIFMGFYAHPLDEKYLEDIEGNWEAFVDQYFGAYYDFSQ